VDHGALGGLDDDDHTNYTTHAEAVDVSGDTMTGSLDMGGQTLTLGSDGYFAPSAGSDSWWSPDGVEAIYVGNSGRFWLPNGPWQILTDATGSQDVVGYGVATNLIGDWASYPASQVVNAGAFAITNALYYGLTNGNSFGVSEHNMVTQSWAWGNHANAGYLTAAAGEFWRVTAANTNSDYLGTTVVSNGTFTGSGAGWATTNGVYTANTMQCPFGTTTTLTQSNRMSVLTGRIYRVTVDLDVSVSGSSEGVLIALGGETNTWSSGLDRTITHEFLIRPDFDEGLRIEVTPTNDAVYLDDVTCQLVQEGDVRAANELYVADDMYVGGTNLTDLVGVLGAGDLTDVTNKTGSISAVVNSSGPAPGIGPTTNELTNAILAVWANLDTDSTDDGGAYTNRDMSVMTNWASAAMDGNLDAGQYYVTNVNQLQASAAGLALADGQGDAVATVHNDRLSLDADLAGGGNSATNFASAAASASNSTLATTEYVMDTGEAEGWGGLPTAGATNTVPFAAENGGSYAAVTNVALWYYGSIGGTNSVYVTRNGTNYHLRLE